MTLCGTCQSRVEGSSDGDIVGVARASDTPDHRRGTEDRASQGVHPEDTTGLRRVGEVPQEHVDVELDLQPRR